MTPGEFRLRVTYAKSGRLRWLSHLEVAHCLERSIRRAGLPYAVTQGFSPHMKVAYGPALPVGTAGLREYLDVWLKEYTTVADALNRLAGAAPADLMPHEVRYAAHEAPSLTAALTIGLYTVEIDGKGFTADQARVALAEALSAGEFEVEHKGKTKVFDLARSVPKDVRVRETDGVVGLDLAIRMGPHGSLRPELLVRASLKAAGIDVSAVRTTRRDTLTEDDGGVWSRPV